MRALVKDPTAAASLPPAPAAGKAWTNDGLISYGEEAAKQDILENYVVEKTLKPGDTVVSRRADNNGRGGGNMT